MRDEIDIFIDSTIAWSEHRQALVLAVDKHQFDRALRGLMARARAGERSETTGDNET